MSIYVVLLFFYLFYFLPTLGGFCKGKELIEKERENNFKSSYQE